MICNRDFRRNPEVEFKLVRFKKSEAQLLKEQATKDKDFMGHPANAIWFCEDHYNHAITNNHLTTNAYYILHSDMNEEE